ncbi:MAG: AraC family transcriptional regulator [Treponema sp.]|nr:AraC family transcriptional regulator [Treponema sp.]
MDSIIDKVYVPQMLQHGFVEKARESGADFRLFAPKKFQGTGTFLLRPAGKCLAVSVTDFTIKEPIELAWRQPEYFLIGFQRGTQAGVLGHTGKNDTYKGRFQAGFHHQGISICFLPDFFDVFWGMRHGISINALIRALDDLNRFTPPPDAAVILRQTGKAAISGNIGNAWIEAKTLELITVVLDWHRRLDAGERRTPPESDMTGISEALRYAEEHFAEPVSLDTLAKQAAMSVSKFTAAFKRHTGFSAGAYLNRLRMEKAVHLLKNTQTPVGEITAMAGYKHHASFSAAFQGQFGAAPSAFRRQHNTD